MIDGLYVANHSDAAGTDVLPSFNNDTTKRDSCWRRNDTGMRETGHRSLLVLCNN